MQLTTLFTTLFFTAALAAPAPAPEPEAIVEGAPILEARTQDLMYLWKDKNFHGNKFTGNHNPGQCKNVASHFDNSASSGKAQAGYWCTVYDKKDCKGSGYSFNASPGSASFPDWINNKASSWKCVHV
jgi:hypothetical protein